MFAIRLMQTGMAHDLHTVAFLLVDVLAAIVESLEKFDSKWRNAGSSQKYT